MINRGYLHAQAEEQVRVTSQNSASQLPRTCERPFPVPRSVSCLFSHSAFAQRPHLSLHLTHSMVMRGSKKPGTMAGVHQRWQTDQLLTVAQRREGQEGLAQA